MNNELIQYLKQKGVELLDADDVGHKTIQELIEKDKTIEYLETLVTKHKCQEIKNQKLIKTLQDKVTQLAPSTTNTGSSFMMASEFKTNFQQLMTDCLPLTFGHLLDTPYLFRKCFSSLFTQTYQSIEKKITNIISQVRQLLNISNTHQEKETFQNNIKIALMKVLQEYWENIAPYQEEYLFQFIDPSQKIDITTISQLNQTLLGQDFQELRRQLHRVIIYMLFQQKQWSFVGLQQGNTLNFSKKQHTCLDGWIKEGDKALQILQGLKRDGHFHANLKNFVIPFQQDDQASKYANLAFKEKRELTVIAEDYLTTKKSQEYIEDTVKSANNNEELIALNLNIKSEAIQCSITKNKSAEFMKENKENNPLCLNKKPKKKDRARPSFQNSFNNTQKSPKHYKKRDDSLKHKRHLEQKMSIEQKLQGIKDDVFSKKKNLTTQIANDISNGQDIIFQDISMIPLKRKALEDLPVSKQIPLKKKTKPESRKNSVGKIVHQHNTASQKDKQNSQLTLNTKLKNKEKIYKDIIKEKLFDDKFPEKMPLTLGVNVNNPRAKTDRKKEQNRPLKIQGNANKLREKYIN